MSDTLDNGNGPGDKGSEEQTTSQGDQEKKNPGEDIPDWVRNKLTEAYGEAAKYRNEKKAAVEAAKAEVAADWEVKLSELSGEKAKLQEDLNAKELELTKYRVADKAGLPLSMAARLRGSTEDELKADAEELKKVLGTVPGRAIDPTQGAGGGSVREAKPGLDRLKLAYSTSES